MVGSFRTRQWLIMFAHKGGRRWYNTTYITIAASVLLLYESQTKDSMATSNMELIEKAVQILEVMDESVVARNAADVIRHFVREHNAVPALPVNPAGPNTTSIATSQQTSTHGPWSSLEVGLPRSNVKFEFVLMILVVRVHRARLLGLPAWRDDHGF